MYINGSVISLFVINKFPFDAILPDTSNPAQVLDHSSFCDGGLLIFIILLLFSNDILLFILTQDISPFDIISPDTSNPLKSLSCSARLLIPTNPL